MEYILFIVWIIVALLVLLTSLFFLGLKVGKSKNNDSIDLIFPALMCSIFWPLVVVMMPFIGIFYLGYKIGKRRSS